MRGVTLTESSAVFSPDRRYRYTLTRRWAPDMYVVHRGMVAFIGLNPSTADERQNDPTVTRCMGYARRWGFSGMHMLNLFAWRDTDPATMKAAAEPVGEANDFHILRIVLSSQRVVCCWGNHGTHLGRSDDVRRMLVAVDSQVEADIMCFGLNGSEGDDLREPKHPLYLRGDARLVEMDLGRSG